MFKTQWTGLYHPCILVNNPFQEIRKKNVLSRSNGVLKAFSRPFQSLFWTIWRLRPHWDEGFKPPATELQREKYIIYSRLLNILTNYCTYLLRFYLTIYIVCEMLSDIVAGILSSLWFGVVFAFSLTLYPAFIWHISFWDSMWHSTWHFIWHISDFLW